jgi:dephospho-CoA kinase
MRIIGLTGSIAMGKSTTAAMLKRLGIPVHDADATVHRLMSANGRAIPAIVDYFPGVLNENGAVDRAKLGALVFQNPQDLKVLEKILHPLVHDEERLFLQKQRRLRKPCVVLDIPLLFETNGQRRCDEVWVVSASPIIQTQRVLRRPGMSKDRLKAIRARQCPDAEKRRRADRVIPTGLGQRVAWNHVVRALRAAMNQHQEA